MTLISDTATTSPRPDCRLTVRESAGERAGEQGKIAGSNDEFIFLLQCLLLFFKHSHPGSRTVSIRGQNLAPFIKNPTQTRQNTIAFVWIF
jgi:hypothetical protein